MSHPAHFPGVIYLYLNIYNAHGDAPDEEGAEYPDMATARRYAREGIRSLLSAEVLTGELNLKGRCDIANEQGRVLETIAFTDVPSIIEAGGD